MYLFFRSKTIKALTCASTLFTIGDLYLQAGVQTIWTGDSADNYWNNPENWSNGAPTSADNAFLSDVAAYNIQNIAVTETASVYKLIMNPGNYTNAPAITISANKSLTFQAMALTNNQASYGTINLGTNAQFIAAMAADDNTSINNNAFAGQIQSTDGTGTLNITNKLWRFTGNAGNNTATNPQVKITITNDGTLSYHPYYNGSSYNSLGYGTIDATDPNSVPLVIDSYVDVDPQPTYSLYNPISIGSSSKTTSLYFNGNVQLSGEITSAGNLILTRSGAEDGYVYLTLDGSLDCGGFDLQIGDDLPMQISANGSLTDVKNLSVLYENQYDPAPNPVGLAVYATDQTLSTGYTKLNASLDVQYVSATIGYLWGDNVSPTAQVLVGSNVANKLTIIGNTTAYQNNTAFPGQFVGTVPVYLSGYSTQLSGNNTAFQGGFSLNANAHLGIKTTKNVLPHSDVCTFGVQMNNNSYLDFQIGAICQTNFKLDDDCYFNVINSTDNVSLSSGALTTTSGGTLYKIGPGTLTIDSSVTVDNQVKIEVGDATLVNNAVVGGTVTVGAGATLAGTGTYGGDVTVQAGSTFIVGSSSTGGVVYLQPGAVLDISGELLLSAPANGSFSVIQGEGDVNLAPGSSLNVVIPRTFFQFGTPIPLIALSNGSISGSFSQITTGPFGLLNIRDFQSIPGQLMMAINPITVQQFQQKFKSSFNSKNALTVGSSLIQNIKQNLNQSLYQTMGFAARAGNGSVENTSLGNLTYEIFSGLLYLPDTNALNNALNQMQPAIYKGMIVVQENNAVKTQNTLSYRFEQELNEVFCHRFKKESKEQAADSCKKDQKNFHVWAAGFGDSLHQKSTYFAGSPQTGYNSNTGGITIGVDQRFAQYFYVGALGGYTDSSVNWTSDQGHADLETGYAGLYLSGISDMFYGNVSLIGGWSSYDAHRNIEYGTVDETAKTRHGGSQILTHADTGINLGWKGFTIRPFDAFDYIAQTENGFTEHGAGVYNLKVKKSNPIMIRNELGLQFAGCVCFGNSKWTISPKISWVREVRTKGKSYKAKFVDTDTYGSYIGYFPDRSLASPGVLISGLMWKDRLALDLYYNGEFADKYADHNYGGEIRFGF